MYGELHLGRTEQKKPIPSYKGQHPVNQASDWWNKEIAKRTIYYWETERSSGQINAATDSEALETLKNKPGLLVIYRENGTRTGIPFIIVWEKTS